MSASPLNVLRSCLEEVVRCLSRDARRARVLFCSPGLSFALCVDVTMENQTLTATVGTAVGIGPVQSFANTDASALENDLFAELKDVFANLSEVTGQLTAEHCDPEKFIPAGVLDSSSDQFRCQDSNVESFLRAAVDQAVLAAGRASSASASLRIEAPGRQFATWVLIDMPASGQLSASTNDADFTVGTAPSFCCNASSSAALQVAILQFLSLEFIDAATVSILIRRADNQANLVGDSSSGAGSIAEQPIYDLPV